MNTNTTARPDLTGLHVSEVLTVHRVKPGAPGVLLGLTGPQTTRWSQDDRGAQAAHQWAADWSSGAERCYGLSEAGRKQLRRTKEDAARKGEQRVIVQVRHIGPGRYVRLTTEYAGGQVVDETWREGR